MIIGSVCENKNTEKEFQLPQKMLKNSFLVALKYILKKIMEII